MKEKKRKKRKRKKGMNELINEQTNEWNSWLLKERVKGWYWLLSPSISSSFFLALSALRDL